METIQEGPFGGEGGDSWEYLPPMDRGITRIIIRYDGEVIRSIKFGSVDADRRRYVYSDAFGDEVEHKDEFTITWPEEYLTLVSGTYDTTYTWGTPLITSLNFETNVTIYGPFGPGGGTPFSLSPKVGAEIVGFSGQSGMALDSIGVHLRPVDPLRLHLQEF